jgi:hypothetical protein
LPLQICLNFCSISSRKRVTAFSILAVFLFSRQFFAPIVYCSGPVPVPLKQIFSDAADPYPQHWHKTELLSLFILVLHVSRKAQRKIISCGEMHSSLSVSSKELYTHTSIKNCLTPPPLPFGKLNFPLELLPNFVIIYYNYRPSLLCDYNSYFPFCIHILS